MYIEAFQIKALTVKLHCNRTTCTAKCDYTAMSLQREMYTHTQWYIHVVNNDKPETEVLNENGKLSISASGGSKLVSLTTAATITVYSTPGSNPDTNVSVRVVSITSSVAGGISLTR